MRRTFLAIAASLGLLLSLVPTAAAIGIYATETCVTLYEDITGGQYIGFCGAPAGNVYDNDLRNNLVSNCHGGVYNRHSPNWNDCASAVAVTNLPPNYKVLLYLDVFYNFVGFCYDGDGSTGLMRLDGGPPFYNDSVSSLRILGGNC